MRESCCKVARWILLRLRRLVSKCEERTAPVYGSLLQFHAGTILLVACRARNRAIKNFSTRTTAGEQGVLSDDSITAIVMAAAFAEAFVNELGDNIGLLRQNASDWQPLPRTVHAASDAIRDTEFTRGSVTEKYVEAAKALNSRFDKGSVPFQDFERLIDLRNAIMHIRPVRKNESHTGEAVTNQLASRGLALAAAANFNLPWFDRLMTPEIARWACKTAHAVAVGLLSKVPSGPPDPFDTTRAFYTNAARFESEDFL